MKTLQTITVLLAILFCSNANAQLFKTLGEKVKETSEKTLEKKVEEKTKKETEKHLTTPLIMTNYLKKMM